MREKVDLIQPLIKHSRKCHALILELIYSFHDTWSSKQITNRGIFNQAILILNPQFIIYRINDKLEIGPIQVLSLLLN